MTYALWPALQEAYVSVSATKTCWKRAIAASPEAVCLDSSLSEATEPDVQLTVFFLRPEAFLASGTISDTDLKFVHLCFEFVQPVVGRSDKFFFSPSLIWPTSASHPPQCFGVSLPFFFSPPPFPLSVGFLCDMKQAVSDSLSVSEWTAWARKLQCHTRGYWWRVLWHLSRERELCLRGGYCSLQAEAPCLWTHNMRVVSKVHSLHPITACTPSHFSVLAFNLLLIVGARAYHNALYKSYFLYLGWDENQHWLWRLAYGCLLLPILK